MTQPAKFIFMLGLAGMTWLGVAAEKLYNNEAISLAIPDRWKITEENNYGDYGNITLEKIGFSASGMVEISWSDNELYEEQDAETLNSWAQQTVKALSLGKPADTTLVKRAYGQFDANHIAVDMRFLFIPHQLRFYNFSAGRYSLAILTTGATEDITANQSGFDTIEESLLVK